MTNPGSLNDAERADLVAYLDGELTGAAAQALEAKLSLHPEARAEADALRRTWDLLDYLPRPEPSPTFTHRTLSRVVPARSRSGTRGPWPPRRRWLLGAGWAAALLLAGVTGYAGFHLLAPHGPGDKELVRDLRLIENKRLYDLVEDIDFLQALDEPDLFGDDNTAS
jgi:anti-sigma factor RsiW